jgi:hypothetical protein
VKTFYSLEDIENLVAQGVRELIVDEDAVLTDVAQDAAARMGLRLLPKGRGPAAPVGFQPAAAAIPGAGISPAPALGARPRGCQHGPLGEHGASGQAGTPQGAKGARPAAPSGGLVDDLVGAVRQIASKGSAG